VELEEAKCVRDHDEEVEVVHHRKRRGEWWGAWGNGCDHHQRWRERGRAVNREVERFGQQSTWVEGDIYSAKNINIDSSWEPLLINIISNNSQLVPLLIFWALIRSSSSLESLLMRILSTMLSMFFAPARYRVVKIACFYYEVVLRTMKNYKVHYGLSWFRPCYEVIDLHPAFLYWRRRTMLQWGELRSRRVR
jgi:hypothetical protein